MLIRDSKSWEKYYSNSHFAYEIITSFITKRELPIGLCVDTEKVIQLTATSMTSMYY